MVYQPDQAAPPMALDRPAPQDQLRQLALEDLCRQLLVTIGEDPTREGLLDTPRRWARMWQEFADYQPGTLDTVFPVGQESEQMVVVSGIRVWSLCEHHLLP